MCFYVTVPVHLVHHCKVSSTDGEIVRLGVLRTEPERSKVVCIYNIWSRSSLLIQTFEGL